ncbi:hypothetical protein EXIGLDRAFT_837302 [Exidia glandulosa HHB12029]|uniref:Uncharacterized protein n=1 Tax=Exidia glandulosa HHB12029 TaxID=1314781 RepID=A0A165GYE8_EXIGL|nr:hypothetical protein EXIGLDRAFT_837302 [Exidia glandulosa HHB12029]
MSSWYPTRQPQGLCKQDPELVLARNATCFPDGRAPAPTRVRRFRPQGFATTGVNVSALSPYMRDARRLRAQVSWDRSYDVDLNRMKQAQGLRKHVQGSRRRPFLTAALSLLRGTRRRLQGLRKQDLNVTAPLRSAPCVHDKNDVNPSRRTLFKKPQGLCNQDTNVTSTNGASSPSSRQGTSYDIDQNRPTLVKKPKGPRKQPVSELTTPAHSAGFSALPPRRRSEPGCEVSRSEPSDGPSRSACSTAPTKTRNCKVFAQCRNLKVFVSNRTLFGRWALFCRSCVLTFIFIQLTLTASNALCDVTRRSSPRVQNPNTAHVVADTHTSPSAQPGPSGTSDASPGSARHDQH